MKKSNSKVVSRGVVLALAAVVALFAQGCSEKQPNTGKQGGGANAPARISLPPPEMPPATESLDLGVIDPFGFRVGELVPNLTFTDIDGNKHQLEDFRGSAAIVIVVRDTGCPVSSRYAPRIARIEQQYAKDGVKFLYLNPGAHETEEAMREEIEAFGFAGPYIHDSSGDMARALRIRATTEVLVLDPSLTLIYRGAVDDQYGIRYTRPEVQKPWLKNAVNAVLANTVPTERYLDNVPGCALGFASGKATEQVAQSLIPAEGLTYHNRISRILETNCVMCHREGGIAPFALDNYKAVNGYRNMIQYVVTERIMPPWTASPATGHWANDRSLAAADMRALLSWVANGAPEGDPELTVRHRYYTKGWTIGEPDAVVELAEPQTIPAEGVVPYKYVYVKTDFGEDRWIKQMEVKPTAPQNTHHIIIMLESPPGVEGQKAKRQWGGGGGADGFFAATVPGAVGVDFGEGRAKKLPAGAWLKFQLHYVTNGRATTDQSKLGFVFADEPPAEEVQTESAFNLRFRIPPGDPNKMVVAKYKFQTSGKLTRLFPHAHVRCKAFRYELIHPDGSSEILLDIPRYDFNWQINYDFAEPVNVEQGSVLKVSAWYDNSADNPYNPDPTAEVRHGEQTWEEMMIGYFDWVKTGPETVPDS